MNIQKHDLHHEFPEYTDEIRTLKMNNNHFAKIFKQYHELDHEVIRIEEGVENTSDDYLEELKKQRLHYKDELFLMIKKYQATKA
ncbi:YdcH family protein [Thalassomonas sp. M1454]|uniref:YdcH family protein n=1 Tax=Thalassomonas sp. M1454 TaxID=2594477 RepID=UPI00117C08AA|nr:YdcH family protein [Thalassomonas sp. M1454]TRX58024.1 DUF465 domain-containing protein [Thalassomonas sp. M1454]